MRNILTLSLLLLSPAAFAHNGLDQADAQALDEVTTMLNDPGLRSQAIKGDSNALAVEAQVKNLVHGDKAKEAEMYKVASGVFATIVQEEGGDMERIQARLQKLQKNPDSLGLVMTEAQKASVRELASPASK